MGFETVASLDADVTVALGKKNKQTGKDYPKQAEGYYLGNRQVEGKRGPSTLHFLQTAKGNLGVWGTTDLNRKLSAVPVGTMVRVTSTGTKATPKGDMFTYKVEVDKENTIEVEIQASAADDEDTTETSDSDDDDGEVYNNGGQDDDQDADEVAQAQALAAAERKAKVDALLRGNKGSKTK